MTVSDVVKEEGEEEEGKGEEELYTRLVKIKVLPQYMFDPIKLSESGFRRRNKCVELNMWMKYIKTREESETLFFEQKFSSL